MILVCNTLYVILFCLVLNLGLCVKKDFSETVVGPFGDFVQKSFGLSEGGFIKIHYNIQAQSEDIPSDSYVLILILNDAQRKNWYSAIDDGDSSVASNVNSLCNQPSMMRVQAWGEDKFNFTVDSSVGSNLYSVVVLQCRNGNQQNPVTIDIKLHMTNSRPDGEGSSHLPIQYVMMTRVYEGFVIAYSVMLVGVAAQYYFATNNGIGRSFFLKMHYLFALTLVFKLIWVSLEQYNFYQYNQSGEEKSSVYDAVRVFEALTSISALGTLFLLSLGWSVLRERLSNKESRFVTACMSMYFIFQFGAAVCSDQSSQTCQALTLVAFVVRSLILLAIIIAMNFTVTQLRAMLTHSPWVPSTPLQYARCKQFQMMRMVFIIYLLLPTAYLLIEVTTFSWREQWVVVTMNELTDFLFFFHLGVTFSPLYEPLLVRSFDGSMRRAD